MKTGYIAALVSAGASIAAIIYAVVYGIDAFPGLIFVAAAGGPVAVAALVTTRLERRFNVASLVGGGVIGPLVALTSHAAVAAFAYFFLLGFADEATVVLDALRIDPRLIEALESPWTLVLLVNLAIVAPLNFLFWRYLGLF